jgi:hypothetical protein
VQEAESDTVWRSCLQLTHTTAVANTLQAEVDARHEFGSALADRALQPLDRDSASTLAERSVNLAHARMLQANHFCSATIHGLQAGCDFSFRVCAANGRGNGSFSCPSAPALAPGRPPAAPAHLTAVSERSAELTVAWNAPEVDGGLELSRFEVQQCSKSTSFEWKDVLIQAVDLLGLEASDSAEPGHIWVDQARRFNLRIAARASIPVTLRVRAVNSAGIGNWTAECSAIAIAGAPSKPALMAVTVDSDADELIVEWLAPEQDGGHEVMLYELFTREQTESEWRPLAIVSIEAVMYDPRNPQKLSATVPAVSPGVHHFKLRACNSAGAGDFAEWGGELSVHATLPPAPLAVTVRAAPLGDQAEVSWRLPHGAGGGLDVTAYHIEQCDVSESADKWAAAVLVQLRTEANENAGLQVVALVSHLRVGTIYRFRAAVSNSVGTSAMSEPSHTYSAKASAPGVPSMLLAESLRPSLLTLSWDRLNSDGGLPILSHEIEQAISVDGAVQEWRPSKTLTLSVPRSVATVRVKANSMHVFRMRSQNAAGFSEWSCISKPASTAGTAPGVATIVRAHTSGTALQLTWAPPIDEVDQVSAELEIAREAEASGMTWIFGTDACSFAWLRGVRIRPFVCLQPPEVLSRTLMNRRATSACKACRLQSIAAESDP